MVRRRSLVLVGLLAGCGEDALAPMGFPQQCGDRIAVDGEMCFKVERLEREGSPPGVLQAGDFNGDGKRDYFATSGFWGGYHEILAPGPGAMVRLYEGHFVAMDGLEHMVFRANARDIDNDGLTDLLTLMHQQVWQGDVQTIALGAVVLRTRPGYQFDYELEAFSGAEIGFPDEPPLRFDAAFGDFDGDGVSEVVFAGNLHRVDVFYVEPDAAPGELIQFDYSLDLAAFAPQENIVMVVVDLDADGRDDLVLVDGVGRVWTLYSDPQGVLVPRTRTDAPVLPPMAGTVLARDVDGDGHIDLVGAATVVAMGQWPPGELAIARGDGLGGFTPMAAWTAPEGPTQTTAIWGEGIGLVHLVLLDLDASGYPALVYALPESRTLVVHPQVGRTLGGEVLELPLDLEPVGIFGDRQDDGTVDLLVSLYGDDHGTKDDTSDDRGPFIDRYRVDP